jgi:hypothetical protein
MVAKRIEFLPSIRLKTFFAIRSTITTDAAYITGAMKVIVPFEHLDKSSLIN